MSESNRGKRKHDSLQSQTTKTPKKRTKSSWSQTGYKAQTVFKVGSASSATRVTPRMEAFLRQAIEVARRIAFRPESLQITNILLGASAETERKSKLPTFIQPDHSAPDENIAKHLLEFERCFNFRVRISDDLEDYGCVRHAMPSVIWLNEGTVEAGADAYEHDRATEECRAYHLFFVSWVIVHELQHVMRLFLHALDVAPKNTPPRVRANDQDQVTTTRKDPALAGFRFGEGGWAFERHALGGSLCRALEMKKKYKIFEGQVRELHLRDLKTTQGVKTTPVSPKTVLAIVQGSPGWTNLLPLKPRDSISWFYMKPLGLQLRGPDTTRRSSGRIEATPVLEEDLITCSVGDIA